MIALSLNQIARLVGGVVHPATAGPADGPGGPDAVVADGPVVTDSREAKPGSLYVARVGEHADGHDFVGSARGHGAVAVLGSRPVDELPVVVVPDVQEGFAALARGVLDRCPRAAVTAITGSSGKTSTKDLLAAVLAGAAPTVAPVASLNSEVGVPLTVCRIDERTRHLVVEMGASGVGHIAYLCRIAPPRIGIVLNVGSAHLGEFGSREAIASAKGELVEALPADGLAVLNADDPLVAAMAARTRARVVLVGTRADAAVRADRVELDAAGLARFVVHTSAGSAKVRLAVYGVHQVGNALAVIAACLELGLPLDRIVATLGRTPATSRWRMEVTQRPDGVTVVNDAYNANPESMRAALRALVAMGRGRRTWAVLGAMRELGPASVAEHESLGGVIAAGGVDALLAVGEDARPILAGASAVPGWSGRTTWVPDIDAAHELLGEQLCAGDVVLVKSSRDSGLRWLGERLADPEASGSLDAASRHVPGRSPHEANRHTAGRTPHADDVEDQR